MQNNEGTAAKDSINISIDKLAFLIDVIQNMTMIIHKDKNISVGMQKILNEDKRSRTSA